MHQGGAARVGEQLAAQADQAARRNFEFEAHAARAVIAHLDHLAAAAAEGFHDDADEIVGDVDDQALERLHLSCRLSCLTTISGLPTDELETFAAHRFDQDGELEFAAAENSEGFRSVGVFDADGNVGEQFAARRSRRLREVR